MNPVRSLCYIFIKVEKIDYYLILSRVSNITFTS